MASSNGDITTGRVIKWALVGTAAVIGITVLASVAGVVTSPFRTASGVINRTMDPANVLRTYELFHDRHRSYLARVDQIRSTAADMARETDPSERSRMRIELGAQRQNCREIVAAYNADAIKTNRSIFQGREAPETLDAEPCNR